MKTLKYKLLIIIGFLLLNIGVIAQGPPPPPGENGSGGNQANGGSAPIGGGLETLLILGLVYGSKKTIKLRKKNSEESEE